MKGQALVFSIILEISSSFVFLVEKKNVFAIIGIT